MNKFAHTGPSHEIGERVFFESPEVMEPLPGDIPADKMDILVERFLERTSNPDVTPYVYAQAAEILARECAWGVDALTGIPQWELARPLPRLNDDQCEELLSSLVRLAHDTRTAAFADEVEKQVYPHIEAARVALRAVVE